jgi:O-antigen ligase
VIHSHHLVFEVFSFSTFRFGCMRLRSSLMALIQKERLPLFVARLAFVFLATVGMIRGGAWASIGIAASLLLGASVWRKEGKLPWPDKTASLFVGLVVLLASASVLSAIDPMYSLYSTFKLATFLIPLLWLSSVVIQKQVARVISDVPFMAYVSLAGAHVLMVLLLNAITTYGPDAGEVTKLNRGFSYFLMLVWPMMAALVLVRVRKGLLVIFILAIFLGLVLNHSRAAQMGTFLAVCAFGVAQIFPRFVCIGLGLGSFFSLGWPLIAQYLFIHAYDTVALLPGSWRHRFEIWDYLSYRIVEKPWAGYGLGNANKLDWLIPHGGFYKAVAAEAAHPHNAIVQLWAELGVAGLLIFACLALWALWQAWRLPTTLRPYALACYTFIVCLLMCAYNFWTDSLWAAMALTGFAFALLSRRELSHS